MPKASVIIRTFNEERHIGNLLDAIKTQDFGDCEIIVVDSGSNDRTLEIAGKLADKILKIESRDFTFGYSLNVGCKAASGEYLVFVSAHTLPVNNQWLANLLSPFADRKVAMVYGGQLGGADSKFSEKRDLQKTSYPNNANAAIRKDLWQMRPFDEYLFGLEDVDWAKYVEAQDFLVRCEPKAAVYHLHNEKWAQVFNRYRREAIAAARIGLPHPTQAKISHLWIIRNIFGDILSSLPNISLARLEEIGKFRYFQWKGSRQGWIHDKEVDLNREKYALFYSAGNKAVMIADKHRAEIIDMPLPELKPGDILIRVEYVGVCRTDLEVYEGSLGYYASGIAQYPIVPGHEFSGTIAGIGANSKYRERFKVGDMVVGECILSNGEKSERREVGVINYNGAYGQFVVIPGEYVHKIPGGLDLTTASLAEPLAVVLRALKRVEHRIEQSAKVAVVGAGPIGNLCSQVLAKRGHKITVFDKSQDRLNFVMDFAAIRQEVQGLGDFNFIIEATGSAQVLERVLRESRINATILLLGFPYGKIDYNFEDIVGKEKAVIGSVGGRE
ncbi:MAG: glycosyltransferase, partial [Candidatus Nealsonbacteria bacterium]|nr:glycosyltransferase [Candidatus Nealsonbacteria bacterium]